MTGAAALSNVGVRFGAVLLGMCVRHREQVFTQEMFSNDCRMLRGP